MNNVVVQPSLYISRTFLSYQTKILYPLKNNSSLLLPPTPGNLYYTLFLWVSLFYMPQISGIIQYLFFCLAYFPLCNVFQVHPCCNMYQNYFIPFKDWIIIHCMYMPHFVYLVICQCTLDCLHTSAGVNNAAVTLVYTYLLPSRKLWVLKLSSIL